MKSPKQKGNRLYYYGKNNPSWKEPIELICKGCGIDFKVKPSVARKGRKYCTFECRNFYIKGSKNPNWQGGRKKFVKCLRECREYKQWRKSIFKKDNYTCIGCNQYGGQLEAHHCIPVSENIALIYEVSNGVTLCKKCHSLIPKKGYKGYEYMDSQIVIIKYNEFKQISQDNRQIVFSENTVSV